MNYYTETLESAKNLIDKSPLSSEEKTFLKDHVSHLPIDMLEIFVWSVEEDPSNAVTILNKTKHLITSATDRTELKKAIETDKKELEAMLAVEDAPLAS